MSGRQPELEVLASLAKDVPSGLAIVELGAFQGVTTVALGLGSQMGNGATIWSVDLWGIASSGQGRIYDDPRNHEVFLEAIANAHVEPLVRAARIHTGEAAKLWSRPIGLLFIDADHTYEGCLADYRDWSRWVVPGGCLALHDVRNPAWPGVQRLVDEVIRPSKQWCDEQFHAPLLATFRRRVEAT